MMCVISFAYMLSHLFKPILTVCFFTVAPLTNSSISLCCQNDESDELDKVSLFETS